MESYPQIISPVSHRKINLYGPAYQNLITKHKYTESYLQSLIINQNDMYINEDVWFNILLKTDIETMASVCLTNKIANNICTQKHFWLNKLKMHHLPFFLTKMPKSINAWIKYYKDINHANYNAKVIISEITDMFESVSEYMSDYHKYAVFKQLLRLIPQYLIDEKQDQYYKRPVYNKLEKQSQKIKLSTYFNFDIEAKEPLTEMSIEETIDVVFNLILEILYHLYKKSKFNYRRVNKMFSYLEKYMVANYKVYF